MKREIATRLLSQTGLLLLIGRAIRWSGLLVLNYHRVGNGNGTPFDHGLWSADAEAFTDQIRFCKSQLDFITPDDISQVLANRQGRYALITFDDGYRDNYEIAFPILKAEGVPATFFIATGFVDSPRVPWWDEIAWMVRTSKLDRIELSGWFSAPSLLMSRTAKGLFARCCEPTRRCLRRPPDATSKLSRRPPSLGGAGRK